jgi:acetylornithine deacetylase
VSCPGPDDLRSAIGKRRDEIIGWLTRLVSVPSENRPPGGDEGPAQDFIEGECRSLGLETDAFPPTAVKGIENHRSWLSGRNYPRERRNVVARWPGRDPHARSILLSGHVDVAPHSPGDWTRCDPFRPVIDSGRLYGRGSADMKGGLAALFWAVRLLKESGFQPKGDILFESVVDEEFAGGNGTLASRVRGYSADLAVLAEPTGMELCPACLGAFLGDIRLTGRAGMPYTGSAIPNPIDGLGRVTDLFETWLTFWRKEHRHPLFEKPGKELNVVLWNLSSAEDKETPQMGTPLFAQLSWILWCYPGMTGESFRPAFETFWRDEAARDRKLRHFDLELAYTYHFVRPWETDVGRPGIAAAKRSFESYTGRSPDVGGAPFSCDLGVYGEDGGMDCLILGPRGDNLHGPDEWVLLEDILTLAGIFAHLVAAWCGDT